MFESYENMIRQQLFDTFWKSNVDAWGSRSKWVRWHLNKVNHNTSGVRVGTIFHRWTGMGMPTVGMGMPTGTHLKMRKHDRTLNSRRKGVKIFTLLKFGKWVEMPRNKMGRDGAMLPLICEFTQQLSYYIIVYFIFFLFSWGSTLRMSFVLITLPSYEYRLCDHKLCLFLSCVWAAIKRCITSMASVVCIQYTTGWPSKW